MKIKNIRTKKTNGYDSFIEVELENGEFIFCNDYISNYKRIRKIEEANDEDFVVTNTSVMDVIDDDELYGYMMCNFDLYRIKIDNVKKYNLYLKTLLEAWEVIEGKES